jgi:hypothetical protein
MRTKLGADFDVDELDVDYDERDDIIEYDGPQPKSRMELPGRIKNMWYTRSSNGNPMFKLVFEAETAGNRELGAYDGCPIWDNIVFTPGAAFRYQPFLTLFGLSLRDIKSRMDLEEDESRLGRKVLSIGTWEPGGDDAMCTVKVKTEMYEEERQVRVARYLPHPAGASSGLDEFAEDEDEEPEERPRRRQEAANGRGNGRGSTPPRRSADDGRRRAPARAGASRRGRDGEDPF